MCIIPVHTAKCFPHATCNLVRVRCAAASTRLREFRHVLKGTTAAGGGTELGPLTGAMLDKEGAFIISPSLFRCEASLLVGVSVRTYVRPSRQVLKSYII